MPLRASSAAIEPMSDRTIRRNVSGPSAMIARSSSIRARRSWRRKPSLARSFARSAPENGGGAGDSSAEYERAAAWAV